MLYIECSHCNHHCIILLRTKIVTVIVMYGIYYKTLGGRESNHPNFNMQNRLISVIVDLMFSVNYTAEMKEDFYPGIRPRKGAVEPRWKTPSQLDICRAFFWIPSRFSIGEIPDDLCWVERVLGADVTDRTAVELWSGCRRGLWVIRLQMSATQKNNTRERELDVCVWKRAW